MKPKAIIFDIDGTIADCRHRLKYLPNYGRFFDAMKDDTVIEPVANLFRILNESEVKLLAVTGRPDSHVGDTLEWLAYNDLVPWKIYMRQEGDYRADDIIKDEIRQAIEQEYEIQLIIDDRPRVVNMWRRAGYTCLQNEWHGDDKSKYAPGKLFMLVGPACAGKDHYIHKWNATEFMCPEVVLDRAEIVSSDIIRGKLCGDFRDQSKNDQVFALFHSLIRTNLEHGVNVIANATHVTRKSRLATLTCAPKEGKVEYIVIDRPLENKMRDAGWRRGINVKGTSLIEHHHNVMQSNLKDILAGDGDPRVTVRDIRQ